MAASSRCESGGKRLKSKSRDRLDDLVQQHPVLFAAGNRPENSDLPAGWFDLASRTCAELEALPNSTYFSKRVVQIKEKFGTLRWHFEDPVRVPAAAGAIVQRAQAQSARTCMACGKEGQARRTRWIQILCDEHAQ